MFLGVMNVNEQDNDENQQFSTVDAYFNNNARH